MSLTVGQRIGVYEVIAPLGAGGMGEVYRAFDTRLNRDVALKVLPDHLLDSERLARFRREAQVVAALNHPNIAAIYGFEETTPPALVLELVEGPTLADRIAQGPIPLDEAVQVARQIVDALEAAHEQGIVHRDSKPANIKLRPDGVVKVLDFGLAKLSDSGVVRTSADPTLSPTITSPAMTGVGVILGTAAYMAPEQAAGKLADRRADIWSFGVVLWEMLTGERLFASNESTSHVLADVLRAPIDFEKIPIGPLRELLRRCLDRDVKTRLRDIGEARVALNRPLISTAAQEVRPGKNTAKLAWVIAIILAIATGISLWAPWRAEPDRPLVRLEVDLGADVALPATATTRAVVLSPDGTRLLFVAARGGATRSHIYIRRLNEEKLVELPNTEDATSASFSPDSKSVAFVAGNRVYRTSVDGGAALRVTETGVSNNNISWGDDGSIVVSGVGVGLRRILPKAGESVELTKLANVEAIHAQAHVLPGARSVLFASGSNVSGDMAIEAVPLAGGARKVLVPGGTAPYYLPSGHLLYLRAGTLFAVRFDPDALVTIGDAVPMVTDVKVSFAGLVPVGTFSMSQSGTLVYRKANGPIGAPGPPNQRPATIEWISASGKRLPLVTAPGVYGDPRLSSDGRLSVTVIEVGGPGVSVYDPRRDGMTRLSVDPGSVNAVWTPDARYVAFLDLVHNEIRWTRSDGGIQPQRLLPLSSSIDRRVGSFSPGARLLAYADGHRPSDENQGRARRTIFTVAVTEENGQMKAGTPEAFSPAQFNETEPMFSPDGCWIAFVTDRSNRDEVWVRTAPPSSCTKRMQPTATQISNTGGSNPRWGRNNELLYQAQDQIMAVKYTVSGDAFVPEKPRVRVEKLGGSQWDLAADGRIAVITPVTSPDGLKAPAAEHTVVFLQNFADEVRRRVK